MQESFMLIVEGFKYRFIGAYLGRLGDNLFVAVNKEFSFIVRYDRRFGKKG